ncbi:hypothetical protein AA313_de0205543 [Arthrobotrys entomopaga]|nr:hypothetical protein AA313_de0205543 [Arthrobotrys entomopaga]
MIQLIDICGSVVGKVGSNHLIFVYWVLMFVFPFVVHFPALNFHSLSTQVQTSESHRTDNENEKVKIERNEGTIDRPQTKGNGRREGREGKGKTERKKRTTERTKKKNNNNKN